MIAWEKQFLSHKLGQTLQTRVKKSSQKFDTLVLNSCKQVHSLFAIQFFLRPP